MTNCHIYKVLLVLTLLRVQNGEDLNGENDSDKFNVVLILAKTSVSERYTQDSGIKFLNFVEKTRVKHCAPENTAGEEPNSYNSPGSDCKQLLKTGIYSLISYCRNVASMSTAIASIENDTFSNGLRFKKSTSEDMEIRYHYPRTMGDGYEDRTMGDGYRDNPELTMKNRPRFITKPEHTEVFKIRSKRQYPPDDTEVAEITDENGNKWDIFGIMANIKLTFFGKFFEKNKNIGKFLPQTSQNGLLNQLGKVSENSLFELVRETLLNVQDNREGGGFLMIILGGDLKEICDIYSNLMQSVKHIVENTDERNTLIVVTGSCPIIDRPNSEEDQYSIPVYVRGPPKAGGIAISDQLYDVPYAIKNLLAEMNGGNYFSGIRVKRNIPKPKEKRNNTGNYPSFLSVLLFSYVLTVIV